MANWMADEGTWSYRRELPADMPDYLRAQYSWVEDDGGNGRWTRTGLKDSQGSSVVQVGEGGRNLYQDEGVFRDPNAFRLDNDLGYVTDEANWDPSIGRARRDSREQVAQAIFLAAAAAGYGAYGLDGAGGAGAGAVGEVPVEGMLSESVAPQVTEVMAGSPWDIPVGPMLQESVAPQVTEQMAGSPFLSPTISVDTMLEESVAPQVTETMSGSPFSEGWLDKLPDLARDLLGGGKGGTNPVLAALMGDTGKLGDHRQDTDPYGLMASGYGPWKGLTDDPKAKVVDAMMKRKQDSIWS